MIENKNITVEELKELTKNFPIQPLFNKVIITLNRIENVGFDFEDSDLSDVQYIVAGSIEYKDQEVKPGDKVLIDIKAMQKPVRTETLNSYEPVYQIEIDPVYFDGKMFAILNDRLIKAKYIE